MPRKAWLGPVLASLLLVVPSSASAVNKTWVGGDGLWNNGAKWNGGTAPGPGDVVYMGNDTSADITLSGAAASVATVYGDAHLVVSGTVLTITGGPDPSALVHSEVVQGGAVSVTGDGSLSLGNFTLGENVTPTVGTLSFSAATSLTGFVKEGGPGLGVFRIGPSSEVTVEPFNVLSVQAKIENDGLLDTAVLAELAPSAGSPTSDGDFVARADGTVSLRPGPGSTMTLSNAASVTGAGRLETSPLLAGAGTVHIDDGATITPGSLAVFGASRLELETDAQVGRLQLSGNTVTGGRHGSGLLVASGPAESILTGGRLGQGTTRLDGPVKLEVGSDATRLSGGAQLRTNGASTWTVGGVELAAGSDWENAGALSITTPPSPPGQTAALSGPGVLRNLGPGSITKSTAQPFLGSGPLTNAGTITVAAGTFGSNPGGAFGTLTQTAGLTVVSGGATLDKTVLLQGGILRGKGTVRALVNSGGTVEPGSSPGTLTVSGDYTQGSGGTLKTEITGTTPDTQYDVLAVGGAATLDGTLALATGGFIPALGDSFLILTAGSRSGQWATVSGSPGYDVEYGAGGVMLAANPSATPTPTPTATPTAGPGPGAPAGATATSAPAAALKPADVIRFPSNRRCVSRRSFRIRLRTPKGAAVSSARVVVNGKRVAVVRGRRLRAPVSLRRLPRGRFKVAITVRLADGRTLRETRRYRTCAPKRRG